MVEVLIVLIFAAACITVFGMILSYKEVAWFAREMFSRILKEYDKNINQNTNIIEKIRKGSINYEKTFCII